LAQALKSRHHVVKHLPHTERFAATIRCDGVVQMKDIDPVAPQPGKASFQRRRDGLPDLAEHRVRQPHLGADDHGGRFQLLQDAAEVLFGLAVAVGHRGVEVVHADFEGAGDGALLIHRIAAHHEPADSAAAETEHGNPRAGSAVGAHFHRRSSV
jgi:hypothetical protein